MATGVLLGVTEEGSDDERLDELAVRLRRELLALDVQSVEPYSMGEAPDGTRADLAAVAGALSVSLLPTVQTIGALVALVRDWTRTAGSRCSVRVEIDGDVLELTDADAAVQQQLVDDWIKRHGAG
jgi:predicted RNA polymerase sigma factor